MNDTLTGYDANPYTVGDRIEIHPATDMWMRGARYGVVRSVSLTPDDRVKVEMDNIPGRIFSGAEDTFRRIN